MPSYDFRLRFNLPENYRINSDAEEIELLELSSGEHIKLVSDGRGTPIKDHNRAAVIGKLFASEDQARNAAEKSKRALLYWVVEGRLGIDFGDGRQRNFVTEAYLAILQEERGSPFRNDMHGIDVYEHVENLMFVSVNAKGTAGKHPPNLIGTFQREYPNSPHLPEKLVLACELYASSFFDMSSRSRFITLVTAVEALLEQPERSDEAKALVEEFKTKTLQSTVDEPTKASIIGSLEWLRYQSIGQAGRELAYSLLPDQSFDGQSSVDFFKRCYERRSQILHSGEISDGREDISHLANVTETFVNGLLLAELHGESQRGAVAGTES